MLQRGLWLLQAHFLSTQKQVVFFKIYLNLYFDFFRGAHRGNFLVTQHFSRRKTGLYSHHSHEYRVQRGRMAFSLLIFAFFSFAGATVPYNTAYFEQKLDHFNFVQDKTFKQRYLYTGKTQRSVI